ncbi:Cell division control protein [Mycena indigotica]|uniref:Cell division control protein n=1 Tax=Mycena indigotica TaxID=2126181 RepID=A0A8H6T2E4_9AGAR|nr:Cell division control protein [Mycena indigotica]KAF7309786.1 Cell division control protein [Mycena indigotica]
MATAVLSPVNVASRTSTSSHFIMPSHRSQKPSPTPGASSSRPTASITVPATPEPAPKTFHRIRSSLEQSLRTATRSKKTAQPVVSDYLTISTGAGKGKERATVEDVNKDNKDKSSRPLWGFRRSGRSSITPSPSPIPPTPTPDYPDESFMPFVSPTLRQGSLSSPALHLYSQALPSPKSQPAIPASSSSTSDALVSPNRTRRPTLQPLQRNLSDLPPTPARERVSRHRATKSNPLNSISPAPIQMRVASSPQTPRRPARDTTPSPPPTPTPASGSRGHVTRSSSSASAAPRGTSPIRPRSPGRRVVTPLRSLSSASTSHLPLSSSPVPPSPTGIRRPSIDSQRRVSIDSPRRPSFREESPSPIRPRERTPSQQRSGYATRQLNASTTSLSGPSNPEHRDLIRKATSMLCKEIVKPPAHMARTDSGQKDWEEVEVRMRALARLERIWGKSGTGGSSSNLTLGQPTGISVGGEERERRLFTEALRDGFVLCQLMNKLRSSSIVRPDSRDDGFVRTSNITKFLAACSSYGLSNEDLFQRDDLIEASSESLARVARTIIALVQYVDAPIVNRSKFVSGQANKKISTPATPTGPYGGRSAAASTPNLALNAHSPSPTPHARKRWSPPSDLPSVRSASPGESSGTGSTSQTPTASTNQKENMQHDRNPVTTDRPLTQDKETPLSLSPPPRSPLRPQPAKVDDGQTFRSLSHTDLGRSAVNTPELGLRQSFVSTSSAMTETTTTTVMSSLLEVTRSSSNKFGTIRTVTTDATSEFPSITRTEGSSIADDISRKRGEAKLYSRETKLSESFIDLSRVEEMDEAGTASRGLSRKWEQQQPPPEVQRIDSKPAIRLGKGKWPDDFVDALQPPPKSPTSSEFGSPSSSGITGPRKIAIVGANKRNESVESLPQFPRRPSHRARHSIDAPILLAKERRDSSPDGLPGGSRVMARRHSSKPSQRSGLAPRSASREGSDSFVPFPRSASGEHSPAGSPPDRATSPLADKPRPRGAKPSRSRFESMINLGGASGNTSASDLLTRDSLDGSLVRKALIVREEGKPPTHFQLGNCIGRGQFGSVYRALNLNTGQMVAVKRLRLEGLKEEEVTQLMREVDLVKRLSHPSIVKYEGMARDEDTLSIVLEYAENGSLGQTLKAFGKLNERLVASYVVKILEGLHYLHSSDVVHCDLKAANILTTKNGNVKLSDFGVSLNLRAMEREIKDVAGTPNWMAPEVIELKGASPKSDIWSLACTVIELLTGRPPYAEIANSLSVMFRIVEDDMPPLPEGCSSSLEDFLKQCFNKDPTKRPSAELLCEHEWLKKNWGAHHKELRPQDSIPFLRRVSADLQKSDAVRFLAQLDPPDSPIDGGDPISSSPPGRRVSFSSRPLDTEISPRDHSFVKTTFSKPMVCRVCLLNVKKSAVLCEQCSLIAHSKCAINAPPTCDLRAQLLLYAQYAEKDNPRSVYSNPLDVVSEPHPMSPASEVAYVQHTPRTSLDGAAPSPAYGGLNANPPTAFKFIAAFKRSRSNLSPEPPEHASSTTSIPQLPAKDVTVQKKLRKDRERPQSVKSTSTSANTSSMRSAESAASRSNAKSMDEGRTAEMQRKRSRLNSKTGTSEADGVSVPGALPVETKHKKRSESRSNCIVQ